MNWPENSPSPAAARTSALATTRVLVVDDDRDFAESLAEVLESHGHAVVTAHDSTSALERAQQFEPHVALIDLKLGVESGTELIQRLREASVGRVGLVCILMTAYAALDTAIQALRNRADDYLLKPLHPEGVLAVISTALARLRAEAQQERRERLASVGSVAAGVAHDLNNILTIVIGETELIEMEAQSASAQMRASLRLIRASSARAVQITQSLLLIARGAPAAAPCRAPCAVLREVAETVLRTLPDGVTLAAELAADSDIAVAIGSSQLYQVALNLLVNARDAVGAHGSIALRCALAPERSGAAVRGVRISVADTGGGIDAETMQRLFEPFFTTKNSGHGLGLATAYGLVRACGGELSVESQVSVGSEFALWLPEAPASELTAEVPLTHRDAAARPGHAGVAGSHVLLCDDDPMLLQALSRALRELGYEVTQARSLVSAQAAWRRDPKRYQLVVTDLRLGQERGLELVRDVLAEPSNVRVVVMSGDMHGSDRDDPVWRRVTCLQKPFNREALRQAVSD